MKFAEIESAMVAVRGWGWEEWGGAEFSFFKMKRILDGGDVCGTV